MWQASPQEKKNQMTKKHKKCSNCIFLETQIKRAMWSSIFANKLAKNLKTIAGRNVGKVPFRTVLIECKILQLKKKKSASI